MDDKWTGEQWVGQLKEFQPLSWVIVKTWDLLVRTWHYLGYRNMIGPRIKYLILFQPGFPSKHNEVSTENAQSL